MFDTIALAPKTRFANQVLSASTTTFPSYLTPESLLAYAQSRLRDLDQGIQTRFAAEQKTINLQKGLGALKDYIRAAASSGGTIDQSEIDKQYAKDGVSGVTEQIERLKELTTDPDLRARLDAIEAITVAGQTSQAATDGPMKAIDDLAKDLGSGRELAMIELQSVVSQRQTALQLTTNLLNTINQSAQSIVQNIK